MSKRTPHRRQASSRREREARQQQFSGGNEVTLLRGGEALFPAMVAAIDGASHQVWLASYIFSNEGSVVEVTEALVRAGERGVRVSVVVDGFGSRVELPGLREALSHANVHLAVFRPIERWWNWLQPGQFRRLHQKLCVVDGEVAFIGGINLLDDRLDHVHGWSEAPRLDFAVQLRGPVLEPIERTIRALWARAHFGRDFRRQMAVLARSARPMARARRLLDRMRLPAVARAKGDGRNLPPVQAAFAPRDNLRHRRAIERSYIDAIRKASRRVDLVSPYFYPGRAFRRVLREAAQRGVEVRLLLQGKLDYKIAGLAARALYDELLGAGVRIFEYTPAFLHAKVGLVDDDWATVGSSNIDPLSLLLNLEANVVLRDAEFNRQLAAEFETAVAASVEIDRAQRFTPGLRGRLSRWLVAWCANVYLRIGGATGRY